MKGQGTHKILVRRCKSSQENIHFLMAGKIFDDEAYAIKNIGIKKTYGSLVREIPAKYQEIDMC